MLGTAQGQTLHFEPDRKAAHVLDEPRKTDTRGVDETPREAIPAMRQDRETVSAEERKPKRYEQRKRQHRQNQHQRESAQVQPEAVEIYREQVTEQVFPDIPADAATGHEANSAPEAPAISELFESEDRPPPDSDRPASDTEPGETANPKDNGTPFVSRDTEGQSAATQNERPSRLRFDDGNRLKFERERPATSEVRAPSRRQRTNQPENRAEERVSGVIFVYYTNTRR